MERKDFLKRSLVLCGAVFVSSALVDSCIKDNGVTPTANVNFTLDLTLPANAALNTIGGSVVQDTVVVIRTDASSYTALSNICTHQGCTVSYYSNSKTLICPCHGGTFNLSGSVISGPPPSGLMKYKTTLNGNNLTVTS